MKKVKTTKKKNPEQSKSPARKVWLMIAIAVCFIFLIIVRFISVENKTATPGLERTYRDQGNYYSLHIPSNWMAQEKIGNETTGLNTAHPQTNSIEVAQFYANQVAVTMQVYERAPQCTMIQPANTTFAGLPATYDAKYHLWTIPTTDATYLISYAYPGIGGYRRINPISPTPVPQSAMNANQQRVDSILATIKLTHTTIPQCNL